MNTLLALNLRIIKHQEKLNELADKYGLNDPLVLAQSRRLDRLINEFYRMAG